MKKTLIAIAVVLVGSVASATSTTALAATSTTTGSSSSAGSVAAGSGTGSAHELQRGQFQLVGHAPTLPAAQISFRVCASVAQRQAARRPRKAA